MPKGLKSAPPQQASLNELWSKGAKAKAPSKAEPVASNDENGDVQMSEAEAPCEYWERISMRRVLTSSVARQSPPVETALNEISRMFFDSHSELSVTHACIVLANGHSNKKRKVIESDDEDDEHNVGE